MLERRLLVFDQLLRKKNKNKKANSTVYTNVLILACCMEIENVLSVCLSKMRSEKREKIRIEWEKNEVVAINAKPEKYVEKK